MTPSNPTPAPYTAPGKGGISQEKPRSGLVEKRAGSGSIVGLCRDPDHCPACVTVSGLAQVAAFFFQREKKT